MTPENKKRYDEKVKRISDAVALKEPDRVPIIPNPQLFPVFNAGYTVAEVIYDTSLEKMRHAVLKYLTEFDPDMGADFGTICAGEGPVLEMIKPKNTCWSGMPNNDSIDENSLIQFIEYPLLEEDEFKEFFSDRSGWALKKAMPRTAEIFEPLKNLNYSFGGAPRVTRALAATFSTPEFRDMIEKFWKINDFYQEYNKKQAALKAEVEELGFPIIRGGMGGQVPYDVYSDFFRGTMLTLEDLYLRPEDIERFIDDEIEVTIERILKTKGIAEGKHVFMALHKGLDGFMNDEMYGKYYWKHLQRIINAIIECGRVPYVFAEGTYDTRLHFLSDVPAGKVIYRFERVDFAEAKKTLGGVACIAGGIPAAMLDWATPDQVRDEVKRVLDICAPGGGYIFEPSAGLCKCKRENVEAMFETVKEYGSYR